jgi:hypothetical protein
MSLSTWSLVCAIQAEYVTETVTTSLFLNQLTKVELAIAEMEVEALLAEVVVMEVALADQEEALVDQVDQVDHLVDQEAVLNALLEQS